MSLIAFLIFAFAEIFALLVIRWSSYERGRKDGAIDAFSDLTMNGEAAYLILPYDIINEESADRARRYLLAAKEEHFKRRTNRKESGCCERMPDCYKKAKDRKPE